MDRANRTRELTRMRVRRFRAVRQKKAMLAKEEEAGEKYSTTTDSSLAAIPSTSTDQGQIDQNEESEGSETENEDDIDRSTGNDAEVINETNCSSDENERRNDEEDNQEHEINDEEYNNIGRNNNNEGEFDEIAALRQWAIESNIQHTHLDSLLQILRRRMLPQLPKSAKSFLKTTSAEYDITKFRAPNGDVTGEFVYFGISQHLQRHVNTDLHQENELYLQFNVDGIPLYKSSSQQFWPILCKIDFSPDVYKPFPVAVYAGKEKPNDLEEYFSSFIAELNELLDDGININERVFTVHIKCFVCDKPARSLIKCIKGHGGYYACERCTIRGERYDKRTVYNSPTCAERSDRSFRNQDQPEHHTGISPLTSILQLNMILHFVLDFMHLCCLGIMKKLLVEIWLAGNSRMRLSQSSRRSLSKVLTSLQSQVPQEFQRTTRSIFDIAKWKATEFRFFLLYSSPIVLKNILPKKLYKHFLLFHAACRILCSEDLALKFHKQAKEYLKSFVLLSRHYYGTQTQVLNMHSLIHMADDVKNMKCSLSKITAFPFENALGKMKKLLRSGNRPLQQLCRRLHEAFFANHEKVTIPPVTTILKRKPIHRSGRIFIQRLRYKEVILSTNSPNNTVLLKNGSILCIYVIYIPPNGDESDVRILGRILKPDKPIFTFPFNSEKLNMWKVIETRRKRISRLHSVASKMVNLKIDVDIGPKKVYVMPLLHQ